MSNRGAIGFGGFLLGLGVGYLFLRELNLAFNNSAWLLIILGGAIVLSALIRTILPGLGIHNAVGGIAGGLVFALILTQGLSLFTGFIGIDSTYRPYSAADAKAYTGASTLDAISLRLGSMNGKITLSTWDKKEYSVVSTITARGSTQKEADDNLASLNKDLVKVESSSLQSLTLVYSSPFIYNPYLIDVEVKLPASAKLDLDLTTSNGAVIVNNVKGGSVIIHTSNGVIQLTNVEADTLRTYTSNGMITGIIQASNCELSTSNNQITIQILSTKGGTYTLQTSNGKVDVTLGSSAGAKLDASTSNAEVIFNIANFTYSRNSRTSKAGQTQGYDSVQNKISLKIETSNAQIIIR